MALQGDVREHEQMLLRLGAEVRLVRSPSDLEGLDGIVFPGGESTAQSKLLQLFGLFEPIKMALKQGLPALGTCAGLILLSSSVRGLVKGQKVFGVLDVEVARNAYGGQLESFEATLKFGDDQIEAAFIRAPQIIGSGNCEVLASHGGQPVIVRQGNIFGATCHPEISGDNGLHKLFLSACS